MSKKAPFLPAIYLAMIAVTGCGSGAAKPSDGGIGGNSVGGNPASGGSSGGGGTAGGLGTGGAGSGGAASASSVVTVSNQYFNGVFGQSNVFATLATAAGMASAGTVTVTGATVPISMTPTSPGNYISAEFTSPLFATGDTLVLSATGGDVPAFSNVQVVAPAGVVVTAPVEVSSPITGANSYMIDTTADLALAWTGGETGLQVYFTFQASEGNNTPIDVRISFDSTLHAGTVPKGMLSQLAGLGNGVLLAQTHRDTLFDDGIVTSIDFSAASDYEGNAVFQ
jgi:hypothetical protein